MRLNSRKRTINKVYSKETLDGLRESPWGTTQREQKEGLEFNLEEYREIDSYCKSREIEWFASAWDLDSQDFLMNFNCNYNKIASAMIVYDELLNKVAEEKKHTFISTGMATLEDIDNALKCKKLFLELMHTVSTYPMNDADANLKLINNLKKRYGCNVGYSGHETGVAISRLQHALLESIIERHITLDRSMYGSDQSASLEPQGWRDLVGSVERYLQLWEMVKKKILRKKYQFQKN